METVDFSLDIPAEFEKEQYPARSPGRHRNPNHLGGAPGNTMSRNSPSDLRCPATGCTWGSSGHNYTAVYFPALDSPVYIVIHVVGYIMESILVLCHSRGGRWFTFEFNVTKIG